MLASETTERTHGRLHLLQRAALEIAMSSPAGTVLEFGVRSGDSFLWLAETISFYGLPWDLIGFDSWQGLPPEAPDVYCPPRHAPGRMRVPKPAIPDDPRFRLVEGWFADTLTPELRDSLRRPVLLVNFDCDLYVSTLQALDWLTPILDPGTLLHFDDWSEREHPEPWGQHRAFLEWSDRSGVECETLAVADHGRRILRVK